MPSNKNIAQLSDLKTIFSKATAAYFTGYQGLNVASITKLRSKFFQHNIAQRQLYPPFWKLPFGNNSF